MLPVVAKGALNAAARRQAMRAFSTSSVAKKDFVQEAYLRELKAYKPPPKAADAHKGQVRDFHAPTPPKAPEAPSSASLSSELDSYARSEPDLVEHSAAASSSSSEITESHQDVNEFLAEAARPVEKEHH